MPSERMQRQIDGLLDEAEAAVRALDWQTVRDRTEAVLRLDPGNEDARSLLEAAHRDGPSDPSGTKSEQGPAAPAVPLPASFAGGRYAVRRFLGEGGRKRVYLAHDERLKRDVAVAVIKTDGLDQQGLSRVHREAEAMAKLGDHANIVTIFDVGDDGDPGGRSQPYIVSQYMSGGAVDTLDLPLDTERTLEIAKGVCRGLSHAHKHGVVHRDLKPGNVWLAADGTAEIGDFGLAVAFEQSRLTMHGMLVGTVAYMPPEQALGSEVTPRADLYSLGCMLYEMVTGRPPFVSDNPTAVISQHINTPPVAPSWHSDTCPQDLEEVILRLLAKDAAERPASADDVLGMLERIDPNQRAASHSDSNVLDQLALGVFVGREQELERLRKAFDSAVAGHGGLVMLVGEPGIGKTRTTQELETYAKMRGAQVLWGRTHESAGAPPYFPWLQAGNQYATAHLDELATLIAPQLPPGASAELSRIFPWLRQTPNFVEPEQVGDPEVAQFRLFDAYTSYLKAIAVHGPLVVALDDLHWADKPTLQLLQHVARELSRTRILIVGNYRDTDINRQSALSETLASLNRETGFDRIVLRGLDRDEVAAYIKARANVEPRNEVLDRIFEETEGNAFFLSEVVNLMAQEGTLTKTSISDIAIPDGVREALGRRLNRLSEETNELLQVAAIIGRDFTYDTLTLLGDRGEDALLKMIEEALEARVIEETDQAGRYRFTHAQMQETLLAELSTTRRVRLHGQVGEALEKRYGTRADERAARLAFHFSEAATLSARFSEKAAHYSATAGRQALQQAAFPDAVRHFRDTLVAREGGDIDDEMADVLRDLGLACYATFQAGDTATALGRAFDYYREKGQTQRAVRLALEISSFVGLDQFKVDVIRPAIGMVEPKSLESGRLNVGLGAALGMLGDDTGAQEAFQKARVIAQALESPRLELQCLTTEAQIDAFHQRFARSLENSARALSLAREIGDFQSEGAALFMGTGRSIIGDVTGATEHADALRALCELSRNWTLIALATFTQGLSYNMAGEWESARVATLRGLEVAPGDARLHANIAYVAANTGDSNALNAEIDWLEQAMKPSTAVEYAHTSGLSAIALAAYTVGRTPTPSVVDEAARVARLDPTPFGRRNAEISLGWLAATTGSTQDCEEQLSIIDGLPGELGVLGFVGLFVRHGRGVMLARLGRLDEAIADIEGALSTLSPGAVVGYAWASYDCARIRLLRDSPGDSDRARDLIDEALGHAQKLGMRPLIDKLVALKLQDQGISTEGDIYTSIVAVADSVQRERPDIASHAAPDGTVTIMFSDIEDSTVLTEKLGDRAWQELLRKHNALIREQLQAHGGYEVKTMGDGFMVAFQSAKKGLDCAVAIQKAFDGHNSEHGEHVKVRIGLHAGEAIKDGDDFYGKNVILASRVAGKAVGGEILVSSLVRALVESSVEPGTFAEGREMELKGLSGMHTVFQVQWPK